MIIIYISFKTTLCLSNDFCYLFYLLCSGIVNSMTMIYLLTVWSPPIRIIVGVSLLKAKFNEVPSVLLWRYHKSQVELFSAVLHTSWYGGVASLLFSCCVSYKIKHKDFIWSCYLSCRSTMQKVKISLFAHVRNRLISYTTLVTCTCGFSLSGEVRV